MAVVKYFLLFICDVLDNEALESALFMIAVPDYNAVPPDVEAIVDNPRASFVTTASLGF